MIINLRCLDAGPCFLPADANVITHTALVMLEAPKKVISIKEGDCESLNNCVCLIFFLLKEVSAFS